MANSMTMRAASIVMDRSQNITKDDCSYYGRFNTTGFGLIHAYEGIPENILVNLIVSAVYFITKNKHSIN